jgi:hypothetical protein
MAVMRKQHVWKGLKTMSLPYCRLRPGIQGQAPYSWFILVSVPTAVAAVLFFAGVLIYCRWKRLI